MENSCIAEPGSGHYLVEKGSIFCGFLLPKNVSRLVEDSPNLLKIFPSNFKNLICTIYSTFSTHTILVAAGVELLTIRMRDERLESTATANLITNDQIS